MSTTRKIYAALPAMAETGYLPGFMACFNSQSYVNRALVVCVNQPDDWWREKDKLEICMNNQKSLELLGKIKDETLEVIDKASPDKGWTGKKRGVGWARKTVMDRISELAGDDDIIISIDADTTFNPGYFMSVAKTLSDNPAAVAISVPYYHKLTGDDEKDRAILHYEIYMRYYAINLWRIGNPFNFTAVGSAIALPVKVYRAIGGITPHHSGEDFYFLQKLRKYGEVLTFNPEKVYPAARYSDRVGFGTGPAMIKGSQGNWSSYPVYPYLLFDLVKQTTDLFPLLFKQDKETPMDDFLQEKFNVDSIWRALRENFKTEQKFVRACHHKIDALRILQFLKWKHSKTTSTDEQNLLVFLNRFYPEISGAIKINDKPFSLAQSPIPYLDKLRNTLATIELNYQKYDVTKQR